MTDLIKIIIGFFAAVILFGVLWEGFKKEKKKKPEYEPEDPNAPEPTGEEFDRKIEEVYGEDTLDSIFKRTWKYFDSHNSDKTVSLGARDYQFDLFNIHKGSMDVETDMFLDMEALKETLAESGFERVDYVSKPMQFAIRGGIVDVFVKKGDLPYRIDFFGNKVESIVQFDIESQKPVCGTTKANIPISKAIYIDYWNVVGEDKHLEELVLFNYTYEKDLYNQYIFIGNNAQKECQEYIMKVFGLKGEEKAYYTIPVTDSEKESF